MTTLGPRLVVAGVSSGAGKTTVATGLLAALTRRGARVAGAKVGPDFIDPGYHALACGRPPRNLDAWMCGLDEIGPLAARAAAGADLLVVEGVMGMFDGASDGTAASTADIAVRLDAPVILVVDAASVSSSVAATVRGFRDHDPRVALAGVVLNRVGSASHEQLLREALTPLGVPVLGCLHRDDALQWRDRHLGLVPVAERPREIERSLDVLATHVERSFDLDAVMSVARRARVLAADDVTLPAFEGACRVGVAAGPAFTFVYRDNLEALEAAGAEVIGFDPTQDRRLPESIDGLLIGGGFPEVYGPELAANEALLSDIRRRVAAGLPTWAECGGLLLLSDRLGVHRMAGAVPARASLGRKLVLGYRQAELRVDTPIGSAGGTVRGHEFHYSTCEPAGTALRLRSRFVERSEGFATETLLATYLHVHAAGNPEPFGTFVRSCLSRRAAKVG